MKFEEALKAMREGKKVWYSGFNKELGWDNNSYLQIHDGQICYYVKGFKKPSDELSEFHFNIFESPFILKDGWVIVDDEYYSILKNVEEISKKLKKKCEYWQNKYDKALHKQIEVEKELESVRAEAVTLKKELDIYQGKYYVFGKLSPEEEREFNIKLSKCEATLEDKEAPDKIDIKITFIGGGEIVIPDEQWDDYRYDGKFFTIIKNSADIAMYNAKNVYSLVLVRG